MKLKIIFFFCLIFSLKTWAQITDKNISEVPTVQIAMEQEPIALTIGNKNYTISELKKIYKRSLLTDTIPDRSPESFIDIFIKNQLLLQKALKEGKDTLSSFKLEIASLKKEYASHFLIDKNTQEALIKEAYERMGKEVNVSHILIALPSFASARDTMQAYEKINTIKNKLLAGEKFENLAAEFSDDKIAKKTKGNLGFISAFQTIYEFENVAYNTEINTFSDIFRTKFGYHIIKVLGKRDFGRLKAAHIFVSTSNANSEVEKELKRKKIFDLYEKLVKGDNFEKIAKEFSEDETTYLHGGLFKRPFGTNELEKSFEEALYSLKKPGNFAAPIQTNGGWHIIKLVSKEGIKSFNDMANYIKNKVKADSRNERAQDIFLKKIIKENNFIEYYAAIDDTHKYMDSTLKYYSYLQEIPNFLAGKTIFSINNKDFTAEEYFKFCKAKNKDLSQGYKQGILNKWYDDFVKAKNFEYENAHLEQKNEEYQNIIQEFKQGMLLFDAKENFNNKIIKDTLLQQDFYSLNSDKLKTEETITVDMIEAISEASLTKLLASLEKAPYALSINVKDILYAQNDIEILEPQIKKLNDLVSILQKNKNYILEIAGNNDPEENEGISSKRSEKIIKYLLAQGIEANRFIEKDNSKFNPISKTNRLLNQRVSFKLYSNSKADIIKIKNGIKYTKGTFKKGENKIIDQLNWSTGVQRTGKAGQYIWAEVIEVMPARITPFKSCQGRVIKKLIEVKEKEQLENLKNEFKVIVNGDLIKKISK